MLDTPGVDHAIRDLQSEFLPSVVDQELLTIATDNAQSRIAKRSTAYNETVRISNEGAPSPLTRTLGVIDPRSCLEVYDSCK